jgi:cob(I)alamin adenosyltransferase
MTKSNSSGDNVGAESPGGASPGERPEGLRITRVYTRTGDDGGTSLTGGQRVPKHDPRVAAYGEVDELNSLLGVARAELIGDAVLLPSLSDARMLDEHLRYIQNMLFTVGGDLATLPVDRHPAMPIASPEHVAYLERACDWFNEGLPPLKDFILPAGSRSTCALQAARAACRRAERSLSALLEADASVGPHPLTILNRLSDLLFILARWTETRMGRPEFVWKRDLPEPGFGG